MTTNYSETCTVVAVASKKFIEGVVMDFHDKRNLTVVLNKSVKLLMAWNGRVYEGRNAGLDFESYGPKVISKY